MLKHNPVIALTSMNNTLAKLNLKQIRPEVHKPEVITMLLDNYLFMVAQLSKKSVCYSKKYGLLTRNKFAKIFNDDIEKALSQ